ncbi:MAG TPA: hypothetical protein VLH09_11815, partial [Bryobacteraceae bacterium]|nr:hypothetical protein [Bryobacteraceae bacterium]
MPRIYPRWIDGWEQRLSRRDTNRKIRDFEWGLDWLEGGEAAVTDPPQFVGDYASRAAGCSEEFFSYRAPDDYRLRDGRLTFTSPMLSPYHENNVVYADFFPARRDRGRAVIVLPQWNADARGHVALCKLLSRFGISALRMSLAYHDRR